MPGTLATNPVVAAWFGLRWVAQARRAFAPPPPRKCLRAVWGPLCCTNGWLPVVRGTNWPQQSGGSAPPRRFLVPWRQRARNEPCQFGRQTEAFEVLSLLRRSRSNPFLGVTRTAPTELRKKRQSVNFFFFGPRCQLLKIASLVKGLAISTFLVQDGWKEHGVKRFLHTTLYTYGELLSSYRHTGYRCYGIQK